MIFDNAAITAEVIEYQAYQDPFTLERIMIGCKGLVEAIVSGFDPADREDLIQEAMLRVQYSLAYYDSRFSLHTYLTTVIRNICKTYAKRANRGNDVMVDTELDLELVGGVTEGDLLDEDDVLTGLIERNRRRFPSLPAETIDYVTELIYHNMREGLRTPVIINSLMGALCSRTIASTVYYSTLTYLRAHYFQQADRTKLQLSEFSLLPDLAEVLDNANFAKLAIIFGDVPLRLH